MIQLASQILSFLWEIIMEKRKGDTHLTVYEKLKRFVAFLIISLSLVANIFAVERLYTISKSHIELVKRLKDYERVNNEKGTCPFNLRETRKLLESCIDNRLGAG